MFGCMLLPQEAVKSGAGSDDSSAQGLDEYLVPPQLLDRMCSMLGWRKLISENFHDYFKRLTSSGEATPQELRKLVDYRRSFSDDEWEVAGGVSSLTIARCFTFMHAPWLACQDCTGCLRMRCQWSEV
jgi:hypothetical protein